MIAVTGRQDAQAIRDAEVARFHDQYGAITWYGHFTREWWGMLPGRRLLEATTLAGLEGQILHALGLVR